MMCGLFLFYSWPYHGNTFSQENLRFWEPVSVGFCLTLSVFVKLASANLGGCKLATNTMLAEGGKSCYIYTKYFGNFISIII